MLGIGDSQAPVPDSPCHQATTWVNRGPAPQSGREKVQGTLCNGNIHRTPVLKPLHPCSPCPVSSFWPATWHTPQALAHICGHPGVTLTLVRLMRGPSVRAWHCRPHRLCAFLHSHQLGVLCHPPPTLCTPPTLPIVCAPPTPPTVLAPPTPPRVREPPSPPKCTQRQTCRVCSYLGTHQMCALPIPLTV